MKQTIFVKQERPLLNHVVSKLNPDVFVHPVWIRFWRTDEPSFRKTIGVLVNLAQELDPVQPEDACRLQLICAFYQNLGGAGDLALKTLDQVKDHARQTGFQAGVLWALWGSCAICFQREKYNLAASYIENLEAALSDQKEWMLAAYLEVIKQSLDQMETSHASWHTASVDGSTCDDLIYFTYSWLQNWGMNFHTIEPDGHSRQGHWLTLQFLHKRGMKWNTQTNGQRQLFSWQTLRGILHLQKHNRNPAPQVGQEEIQEKAAEIAPMLEPPQNSSKPMLNLSTSEAHSTKPKSIRKAKSSSPKKPDRICLTVQMLGPFSITIEDTSPKLPSSRALSVFKYLLLHHKQDTPREVLMDLFWPDAEPEAARNNLNVSIHHLRQAIQKITDLTVISFEEGAYRLASHIEIWLDVEEFDRCVKAGRKAEEAANQLTASIAEYEVAINLYQGDLLADSPYEEWLILERERLRVAYLDTLDHLSQIHFSQERYAACVTLCRAILERDICREDVHCRIMRCYSRLGQDALALRQYQACAEALHEELDVEPAPETIQLYQRIRHREAV